MKPKGKSPSPLSPAALQILAALATDNLHGYGITLAVAAQSLGKVQIGPGTLYDNLKRLMEQGWICDLQPGSDNERRLYCLTAAGRAGLSYEISRLDHLIRQTKLSLRELKQRTAG